jgi:hypothetical protein
MFNQQNNQNPQNTSTNPIAQNQQTTGSNQPATGIFGNANSNVANQQQGQANNPPGQSGFGNVTNQQQQFPPSSSPFGANNPQSNLTTQPQQGTNPTTQPVSQPSGVQPGGTNLFTGSKPATKLFGAPKP